MTSGKRKNITSIVREEKKNKHVETMKKEHAKAISEWQWKVREKWSEDGDQQKTEADPAIEEQSFRKRMRRCE